MAHQAAASEIANAALAFAQLDDGAAPARAYVDELLPSVLDGTSEPGRVFDREVGLDAVPDGYAAMDARESIKVLIRP